MAESIFSFDALDELLATPHPGSEVGLTGRATTSVTINTTSTTNAPSLSSSLQHPGVSSGESPPFTLLGLSLTGGGSPAKRYPIITALAGNELCLGHIGSTKFCVRPVKQGSNGCGTTAHTSKKFTPPALSAFVKELDVRAFCSPVYSLANLSPEHILRLQGVHLTMSEWDELFTQLGANQPPKWLTFGTTPTNDASPPVEESTLLSPVAHEASGGILALVPALSFDDSIASDGSKDESPLDDVQIRLLFTKFRNHFSSLKQKWNKAFTEVETGYGLLVRDLQRLQVSSSSVQNTLGSHNNSGSKISNKWFRIWLFQLQVPPSQTQVRLRSLPWKLTSKNSSHK
jgi:hypothetical protein